MSLAILAGVLASAGCGASTATYASTAPTQPGHHTPSQSNADVKQMGRGTRSTKHLVVRNVQTGHSTAASEDDNSADTPRPPNPCKLVSLSEAQAITAGSITSQVEAPLGPTCVYERSRSAGEITLAVGSSSVSQIRRQLHSATTLKVGAHQGFCGRLGAAILYVPLAGGRVLQITAPCSVAKQFATKALTRLSA